VCSRNAHCAVCCSRYSMRGSRPSSTGPYRTPAPAASSGWPCAPRYSLQIASIRCHFGAVAPRIFPASSSALSTTGRASGDTGTEMRSHASSCSGSAPVAVLTAAFRARTVSDAAVSEPQRAIADPERQEALADGDVERSAAASKAREQALDLDRGFVAPQPSPARGWQLECPRLGRDGVQVGGGFGGADFAHAPSIPGPSDTGL